MSKQSTTHPVYKSVNKPLTVLGAERRLFFLALVVGAAAFNFFGSLVTGLLMFAVLYAVARWMTASDPQMLRILLNLHGFGLNTIRRSCPASNSKGDLVVKLSRILKDYRQTGALSELINLYGFVDPHTFLTKSGDLGVVIRVRGVDYECLDPDQLDRIARRFEASLKILDEKFRIYQHLLKRSHAPIPRQTFENPVVDEAIKGRVDYLESKANELYSFEIYFTVLYEGWRHRRSRLERLSRLLSNPKLGFMEMLSGEQQVGLLEAELDRHREVLTNRVNSFLIQLREVADFTLLPKDECFRFFRHLVNLTPDKADAVSLKHDLFLDYFVSDEPLECHRDHLRLGDRYVKVLTLKDPPSHTITHLLRGLLEIPTNFILTSEFKREDSSRMRRLIRRKRRHFHNAKHSLASYLFQQNQNGAPPAPGEMLTDDAAVGLVVDLGHCLSEMEIEGRYFGRFSLTVVLHGRGPGPVGEGCRRVLQGLFGLRCGPRSRSATTC